MDDQAETVLLHLTRGSGLIGVAAIRPLRDGIVRPLLAIGRAETQAICAAAKIKPREDPSNRSLKFARNRVRRRVLPELERINPRVRAALARFADAAAELEARITAETRSEAGAGATDLDVTRLPSDPVMREHALADAWSAAGGITLSARHRHALIKLASTTDGSSRIDLPGGQAIREYARLRLGPPAVPHSEAHNAPPARLARGAMVEWHGWRIALDMPSGELPYSGAVDAATAARLAVRARRPGDRVPRLGKVQDIFVDAKIPARHRDAWPLVTLDDAVIWVPGVTPAPQSGGIAIAAGPVESRPTNGESRSAGDAPRRQVASKAEPRRRGGNRGRA
jgi:tRNA(Ile)-lysidine synthase